MEKNKPEKLILKIPKWFWKLLQVKSVAYCVTRMRAISFAVLCVSIGIFGLIFAYHFSAPLRTVIVPIVIWAFFFSLSVLWLLPTIFIRRDCFECQFGFHIITHERNHLSLRESEEIVEEETVKQTGEQLIPILLSDPKLCKNCPFSLRKTYSLATFNYLSDERRRSNC